MKTLHLTSPHMRGHEVLEAQKTLNGANVFHHDYFGGAVDGDFGPVSAASAKTAKWFLGYAEADLQPIYGDLLDSYLTGAKPLPTDFVARRQRRLAGDEVVRNLGEKALAELAKHVGETENPPNSNHFAWATDWYGFDGPWCAMSDSKAYHLAGSKVFIAGKFYAYVPYIIADAAQSRNGLVLVGLDMARAGDLVCFDWDKDGIADHVGLFDKRLTPTTFSTVEGNTSSTDGGSQSNGGGVYRKVRNRDQVRGIVRVTK